MTLEKKIAMANQVRSRDRFGPVSPEELAALPGTETELWIETANGCEIHVFEERPDTLRDDTEAFALRLIKAGVCVTAQRIPEAMHGFTTNRTPGWERALDAHCKFFREHL